MAGAIKINGKRKGDRLERAVVLDQERLGRTAFRVRQGGGEPVDIVALQSSMSILFIQVKSSSPYLIPAEREAFLLRAASAGAIPVVAWKSPTTKKIEYKTLEIQGAL